MLSLQTSRDRKEGLAVAKKKRFVEVYSQGIMNVAKVLVDTETGLLAGFP